MAGTAPLLPLVERRGYPAHFNDLNALHLHVNRAKLVSSRDAFLRLGRGGCQRALLDDVSSLSDAPREISEAWIDDSTLQVLTTAWRGLATLDRDATYLLRGVLLLCLRSLASFSSTANPTWLKPGGVRPRIRVEDVLNDVLARLEEYYLAAYAGEPRNGEGSVLFTAEDAATLRSGLGPADVVCTSPPFCNRVDWGRLYAPECYFLRAVGEQDPAAAFLGTTEVRTYGDDTFNEERRWLAACSPYVDELLCGVRKTQIEGERGSDYYVRYFTRYFALLFRVFDNTIANLTQTDGRMYYAVQDNAHRGQLISLEKALGEFLQLRGFSITPIASWERHHLGLRNVSRKHMVVRVRQIESLVVARR
jgi:hypothetical protein